MTTTSTERTVYVPLDQRDPTTIRAAILARSSDTTAKPEDMLEQVLQCQEFIAAMGWPPAPDTLILTEAKSGIRNVERPVIDQLLARAQRGEIDVIVCREWERVSRKKMRRYQIVQTAQDFGVEFRYANLAKDHGKMPDTLESRIVRDVLEEVGEMERDKLVERMGAGKTRRYVDGLPHGGVTGPLYGYAAGVRRLGKHGRPMGLLTWVIDEAKAKEVRWLFDTVDASDAADVSLHKLTREVERRGVPTPSGRGRWEAQQIRNILRNPKYCGLGRNYRWFVTYTKERDEDTGRWHDVKHTHDKMRDAEQWERETYPTADMAIPPIIERAQWERVQQKLKDSAALKNRGGPRGKSSGTWTTLLNGGFVYCAECGHKMTRGPGTGTGGSTQPQPAYYQCNVDDGRNNPRHPHHKIPAQVVDRLALQLLAQVLTDPEQILELADAAEEQVAAATTDEALAAAHLAAYQKRLAEIAVDQDKLLTALGALSGVPGMAEQIAGIRARLAKLDQEREQAEVECNEAVPRREHAHERATFLRNLFTVRDEWIDFTTGEMGGEPHVRIGAIVYERGPHGDPIRSRGPLQLCEAAALLGVTQEEVQALVPVTHADPLFDADIVSTADVVFTLLQRLPRERVRKLLRSLNAVVKVTRPRPRAEVAARGQTLPAERVSLQVLGTVTVRVLSSQTSARS